MRLSSQATRQVLGMESLQLLLHYASGTQQSFALEISFFNRRLIMATNGMRRISVAWWIQSKSTVGRGSESQPHTSPRTHIGVKSQQYYILEAMSEGLS